MLIRFFAIAIIIASVKSACNRDKNIEFQKPLYLSFGDGFFYIHGLTNGENAVVYKHPDDSRIFGQYTFKDERCLYETVYYYVFRGKYEFTNPYIVEEEGFNITNKISFLKNGAGYEIEYNLKPKGYGIFQNLGSQYERRILPDPVIKRNPVNQPAREVFPNLNNIGKQNLKVSYLKNGENYIQRVNDSGPFPSIEGSYTFKTSDNKFHTIVYEVPLDYDYSAMVVKEYEIATQDNFFRTGKLDLQMNGTRMDVRYFINRNGFHIADLQRQRQTRQNRPQNAVQNQPLPRFPVNRPARNQAPLSTRPSSNRILNPTFSRPDLLTGERSIQPGK